MLHRIDLKILGGLFNHTECAIVSESVRQWVEQYCQIASFCLLSVMALGHQLITVGAHPENQAPTPAKPVPAGAQPASPAAQAAGAG